MVSENRCFIPYTHIIIMDFLLWSRLPINILEHMRAIVPISMVCVCRWLWCVKELGSRRASGRNLEGLLALIDCNYSITTIYIIDSSNRCSPICKRSLPDQVNCERRKTHMEGSASTPLSRSIRSISSLAIFVIGSVVLFPISLQAQLGKVTTSVIA